MHTPESVNNRGQWPNMAQVMTEEPRVDSTLRQPPGGCPSDTWRMYAQPCMRTISVAYT